MNLFDLGIPSAKDSDYLSSNKMDEEERSICLLNSTIGNLIRIASIKGESKADCSFRLPSSYAYLINSIIKDFQEIGYEMVCYIIQVPKGNESIYNFQINWVF